MTGETLESLQAVSKNVQSVGRSIGSTRIDIEGLLDLSAALRSAANTLEIYAKIETAHVVDLQKEGP